MSKKEFIQYFIAKYGKDFNLKSELFRGLLLEFEELLEDVCEKCKKKHEKK